MLYEGGLCYLVKMEQEKRAVRESALFSHY